MRVPVRLTLAALAAAAPFHAASGFEAGDVVFLNTSVTELHDARLLRLDPITAEVGLLVDLPATAYPSLTYCAARDRLLVPLQGGTELATVVAIDEEGGITSLPAEPERIGVVAARGDGLVTTWGALGFGYLDGAGVAHPLLDEDDEPFAFEGSFRIQEMTHDPDTGDLIVSLADIVTPCQVGDAACLIRLPLSPDGTRVVGPPVMTTVTVSHNYPQIIAGLTPTTSGRYLLGVGEGTSDERARLRELDPVTGEVVDFAFNGPYPSAGFFRASIYVEALDAAIVFDSWQNVLLRFDRGATGAGVVLDTGPISTDATHGEGARLLRIPGPTTVDVDVTASTPARLRVRGARPARGPVAIELALDVAAVTEVTVFDAVGREVARLVDGPRPAGRHHLTWDGTRNGVPAPDGVYFVRAGTPGVSPQVAKITRLR